MNTSIETEYPVEIIPLVDGQISPFITKCEIKVLYLGENRNGSYIDKDVALKIAETLRGSMIVGHYIESKEDFGGHDSCMVIEEGQIKFKPLTQPYGFVDLNAKVWFKWYQDGEVQHQYLVTEGYLWTKEYPECQRVIERGNNQSMELDEETLKADWSEKEKGLTSFFIINEAIISKLCILGEDVEPCFEGSQITKAQSNFSLDETFKTQVLEMLNEINTTLSKGGTSEAMENTITCNAFTAGTSTIITNDHSYSLTSPGTDFITTYKIAEEKCPECGKPLTECACDKKKKYEEEEEKCPKCGKPLSECICKDEEDEKYSLLEKDYEALKAENESLKAELESLKDVNEKFSLVSKENEELKAFKAEVETAKKEEMIASFYMLSDEDKKPIIDNIDKYSLDDIEAKLSVICVRKKVNFSLDENEPKEKDMTFSLDNIPDADENVPAWIKEVLNTEGSLNI